MIRRAAVPFAIAALLVGALTSCQQQVSGRPTAAEGTAVTPAGSGEPTGFPSQTGEPTDATESGSTGSGVPDGTGAAAFDGSWSGSTAQGGKVAFTVKGGTMTEIEVSGEYGGAGCGVTTKHTSSGEIAIEAGQFHAGYNADGGTVIDGKFDSDTTASGTVRFIPGQIARGQGCTTVSSTWQASKS